MIDRQKEFDEFLRLWIDENIVALGPRVDPDDREYIVKQRASELTAIVRERAWRSALIEKTRSYGTVVDYIRERYRAAEAKLAARK